MKFKEQSFFLSFHPRFKIESAMKYLYKHGVAFPVQCLSGVRREREKICNIASASAVVPDIPVCL